MNRLSLALVVLAVCGCSRPPATHPVDYYRAHADERAAMMRACTNDPGTLGDSPDCVNAREAARLEDTGSLRSLPPLGLPAPQNHPSAERKSKD